ncbi:hypothetical protein OG21DRAFT_847933 [Imleria badia]|nr:hypothetical protein OG21DRAFT_847933 [Imleria badia]
MVLIMGGFPMSWLDARAWALRHWPDIDIYDERKLPYIVERHQRMLGGNMMCIAVSINAEAIFFIVLRSKRDPLSTPHKYRKFAESEYTLKCKELIFNHEGDKELAEKTQYTTIADPWKEWSLFHGHPSAPASSREPDSEENDSESE